MATSDEILLNIKQKNKQKVDIVEDLIQNYTRTFGTDEDLGVVLEVADGIVTIIGLSNISYGEMIEIIVPNKKKENVQGLILNIEMNKVSAVIFSNDIDVLPGYTVRSKEVLMRVPVGQELLGRVINPLGEALDNLGKIKTKLYGDIEQVSPSIISRAPVRTPLETGLKVVDSIVPIGHGQRELIIGDTKTGKTSIAIDAILNQRTEDTICVYVAIGQKRSSVARIAKIFKHYRCMSSSIIVAATASETAAMQYIAPYSACTIAESFMKVGLRVLIIYDDLSKHAVSYRQLSLLLRRPPGREGYPGDVFFLHSRLLERAANLKGSGSITALPIIETIQGDVSAYVPTNVISITDGQIFLETELFSRGIRPAVSPGLSVSRVGSAAQNKILKNMAGDLKLLLAQYREVEGFSKLGLTLDDATTQLVKKGSRLTSFLIQNRFQPKDIALQILSLYPSLEGYISKVKTNLVNKYESELKNWLNTTCLNKPISSSISYMEFPIDLVKFLLWHYTNVFMENTKKNS